MLFDEIDFLKLLVVFFYFMKISVVFFHMSVVLLCFSDGVSVFLGGGLSSWLCLWVAMMVSVVFFSHVSGVIVL